MTAINSDYLANKSLKIFQYWDTGIEGMPDMIRYIYDHNLAMSHHYNFELILITQQTINDHITPIKAFKNLSSNHQSDICRFFVLDKYDGIWLDSDVIILKNLNKIFDEFKATNLDMVLDIEFNKKIGCATILAKSNTVCSNYCVHYIRKKNWKIMVFSSKRFYLLRLILKILYKLGWPQWRTLEWSDIGPNNVENLYLIHSDKIKLNLEQVVKKGCNFISWIDVPGYNTSKWLLGSADQAAKKARMIFNNTAYVLTWTIYIKNNFKTSAVDMVFHNKLSVFYHLLKLSACSKESYLPINEIKDNNNKNHI